MSDDFTPALDLFRLLGNDVDAALAKSSKQTSFLDSANEMEK